MSDNFKNIPYDPVIGQKICIKIAQGYELENLGDEFPNLDQIMLWLNEEEEFFQKYQRAKHLYSDILTDRANGIVKKAYQLLNNSDVSLTPSQRLAYSRMVIATTKWMVNRYTKPMSRKNIMQSDRLSPNQIKRVQKIKDWVDPIPNNSFRGEYVPQTNIP
ncbi:MAG: hypothetical protein K1X44_01715 [Alphaproteobacteria bacterium]|nr:hypothetical protein [Alphaproteobacteria bacterium]